MTVNVNLEDRRRAPPGQPDFSLVLGGPLYQLLLRAELNRPSMDLLGKREIAAVVVTCSRLSC